MKENFTSKATLAVCEREKVLIRVPEGEIIHSKASLHPLCNIATVKCLFFCASYFLSKPHVAQSASWNCGEGLLAILVC